MTEGPWGQRLRNWLVTGTGPTAMLVSAIAILAITVYLYGLMAMHIDAQRFRLASPYFQNATDIFGMVGAAGGVLLYYSMWFYWAWIDESKTSSKRVWFFLLLLGLWYGSCVYYFFVYRPQVNARRREATA
jgi:hypothetical protein